MSRSTGTPSPIVHRVLVATDLSEAGNLAVRHAYSLLPSGGELRLLHVCLLPLGFNEIAGIPSISSEPLLPSEEMRAEIEQKLQALTPAELAASAVETSYEVIAAHDAAAAIVQAAERFGADVICLGTTGASRVRVAFLGSTVQSVIARAHRPVMAVPLPRA